MGKIILYILLALVLLLAVFLLIPVKIRASYEAGAPVLWVRYGPVKLQLFPMKKREKKEEPEKEPEKEPLAQKKEQEKNSPAKKEKPEKKKKPKARINKEQIFYALEKLPPILGRALRRTKRSIRIEPLKVHVLVAGNDPADTALLYGRLEAALGVGLPVLHRVMRIREQDIQLFLDFNRRQMDVIADVGVVLRPCSLVWIALRAGGSLLKWFFGFRKLASPPPEDVKQSEIQDTDDKKKSEHEAA